MTNEPEEKSGIGAIFKFSWIVVGIAALIVAGIFLLALAEQSRH